MYPVFTDTQVHKILDIVFLKEIISVRTAWAFRRCLLWLPNVLSKSFTSSR